MRNLAYGALLVALTSNSRPFIWFNLRDPRRVSAAEIERLSAQMAKAMVAASG